MAKPVVVLPYDIFWPSQFDQIKRHLLSEVNGLADSIEHVGSTSVAGLAAKPVIDIDIVIKDESGLNSIVARLAAIGYEHKGNQGVPGREAFKAQSGAIKHHLYVCSVNSLALRNHLLLRDALRADEALRDQYAALKLDLAAKFPNSIDSYIEGKTDFILKILERGGLSQQDLALIREANS